MIAFHSPHTHILCLIEHSLKEQLLNILVSLHLRCVAPGLIHFTIQARLWKQNFRVSISAACCASTRLLPDLEGIYFHYVYIYLMHVGNWNAVRIRSGLLPGFRHQRAYFSVAALSMQLAAGDAQQHCKTGPRNFSQPNSEDGKLNSVYETGRSSI